jgi:hypothetical protein
MITSVTLCPDCRAPLTGAATCDACGLPLLGPTAARLWAVDQRLAGLDTERTTLLEERVRLLAALRQGEAQPPLPVPPPRAHEATPRQVQNTLLGLGALLLAVAGLVFAAVTYRQLGLVGRAAVLLTLTAAAAYAPLPLVRRRLTASAEAITCVALALSAVDAWALRQAGLAPDVDGRSYAAVATAVLAVAAAAHARAVPVRASQLGAAAFAQLPVLLLLARLEVSAPVAAVSLAGLAAVDLAVADRAPVPLAVRRMTVGLGGLWSLLALAASAVALGNDERGGAWGLVALAALAAAASVRVTDQVASRALSGAVVPLLAGAAWGAARPSLSGSTQPLVLVAVALLALQVTGLLPRSRREGPVVGSLLVTAAALLAELPHVLLAVAGPFTWLGHAWERDGGGARDVIAYAQTWDGTAATLAVLAAAAGCAVVAGALLDRLDDAAVPAGVLLALTVLVLPLGLDTGYAAGLALLLGASAALAAGGVVLLGRRRLPALALVATAAAGMLLAVVWSVADESATLAVLPVAALFAAGLACWLPGIPTAAAALLGGAELAAHGVSQDLARDQVGGLLLLAPAACVALTWLLRGRNRLGLEAAAAVLATACVVLAAPDPGWLSWALAVDGLLALALAIRPDRRQLALAGGLLLTASSWVRLADAGVHAPEPYVAPLATAALLFGYLRRRTQPGTGSMAAYGAGLSVALVPSLVKAFSDDTPTRALLLLVGCAAVVLVGARHHLRAPLVVGGAVLALDAVHLLAPYASALPRWSVLAAAGTVLVVLGATYEQRLRDLARLRSTYQRWT